MEIFIPCPDTERLCPICGSRHCVIKDSGHSLTIRHIAVAGKGSFLSFHVPRLLFSARPYFVHPSMKLPAAAFLAACVGFTGTRSIRDIAIDNGLTEQQVLSVLCSVDFRKPTLSRAPSVSMSSRALPAPTIMIHTAGTSTVSTATFPPEGSAASSMSSPPDFPEFPAFLLHGLFPRGTHARPLLLLRHARRLHLPCQTLFPRC